MTEEKTSQTEQLSNSNKLTHQQMIELVNDSSADLSAVSEYQRQLIERGRTSVSNTLDRLRARRERMAAIRGRDKATPVDEVAERKSESKQFFANEGFEPHHLVAEIMKSKDDLNLTDSQFGLLTFIASNRLTFMVGSPYHKAEALKGAHDQWWSFANEHMAKEARRRQNDQNGLTFGDNNEENNAEEFKGGVMRLAKQIQEHEAEIKAELTDKAREAVEYFTNLAY